MDSTVASITHNKQRSLQGGRLYQCLEYLSSAADLTVQYLSRAERSSQAAGIEDIEGITELSGEQDFACDDYLGAEDVYDEEGGQQEWVDKTGYLLDGNGLDPSPADDYDQVQLQHSVLNLLLHVREAIGKV